MEFISNLIIPLMVLGIIIYGVKKRVNVYDTFVEGAKESFSMVFSLFPYILGMILGINVFLKSGFLDMFLRFLTPVWAWLHIPVEIIPMMIMRPISGSSSIAILNNLLETHGPDSSIGILASVIQGSTETTLYILTLYFGVVGIKKIRHALWVGLLVDLVGIIASVFVVNLFF